MQYEEKLKRLKALHILKQIPDRQLAGLAEFLRPRELKDGEVVFLEGSTGMSLYFVSSGRLRISKRVADGSLKDLALLASGDFFGEMALIDESTRSASASALGPCVVFELFRGDLNRWVKSNPQQAVQFFAELVHIQSQRLRKTSNELTLHFDLSNLLLDQSKTAPEFLAHVLERVVPHLEGAWSGAAYLYDESGAAAAPVAAQGEFKFEAIAAKIAPKEGETQAWLDASTFYIALAGREKALGRLLFHSGASLGAEAQGELGRTLTAVARLVSGALEIKKLSRS